MIIKIQPSHNVADSSSGGKIHSYIYIYIISKGTPATSLTFLVRRAIGLKRKKL
jgi:hypothetical protein